MNNMFDAPSKGTTITYMDVSDFLEGCNQIVFRSIFGGSPKMIAPIKVSKDILTETTNSLQKEIVEFTNICQL